MNRGVEIDRDVATSLPGTIGVQKKKNVQSESKSTYRRGAKVPETGTSSRVQKIPLSISNHPNPDSSEREPEPQSNANLRQKTRADSAGQCAKLFSSHRIACVFFGVISLVLNTIFTTAFVLRWRSTNSIPDVPKLAIVGCATSIIFGISSSCLIVGSALQLRSLLWIPMILTLVQFIPATIFVFVLAEINHASTWVSVTTSCVLGIVVLAFSFYQLLQVVSLYVDLAPEHGHSGSSQPVS